MLLVNCFWLCNRAGLGAMGRGNVPEGCAAEALRLCRGGGITSIKVGEMQVGVGEQCSEEFGEMRSGFLQIVETRSSCTGAAEQLPQADG